MFRAGRVVWSQRQWSSSDYVHFRWVHHIRTSSYRNKQIGKESRILNDFDSDESVSQSYIPRLIHSALISALEGKAILDALAGRNDAKAFQVILNGHSIPLNALKRRLVYVRSQSFLSPELNVAQTLTFYSHLRRPPKHSIKVTTSEQVRIDNLFLFVGLMTYCSLDLCTEL